MWRSFAPTLSFEEVAVLLVFPSRRLETAVGYGVRIDNASLNEKGMLVGSDLCPLPGT